MAQRYTAKGHKLVRYWRGAGDSYADGHCECGGWGYRGWTTKMGHVISQHSDHVRRDVLKLPPLTLEQLRERS